MGVRSSVEKIAKWREIIGVWRVSEKTQVAFCKEQALDVSQFGYWKQRLVILDRPKSPPMHNASAFVHVMPQATQAVPSIQMSLPNQITLRIPGGTAEQDIVTLLRALRSVA